MGEAMQGDVQSMENHRIRRQENREKYAGTYGAYCCGNFTVTYNSVLDTLSGTYGECGNNNLVSVDDENDRFFFVWREPYWFIPPVADITFYSSDGGETMDQAIIPFMLPGPAPPVFVRDLNMDSQPSLPPDCEA